MRVTCVRPMSRFGADCTEVGWCTLLSVSPRRAKPPNQSRQQIALKLRDRRVREETLIVQAADALERRIEAEAAVSTATDDLLRALSDLDQLGFAPTDVARILDVEPSVLGATAASVRSIRRAPRLEADETSAESEDLPE